MQTFVVVDGEQIEFHHQIFQVSLLSLTQNEEPLLAAPNLVSTFHTFCQVDT